MRTVIDYSLILAFFIVVILLGVSDGHSKYPYGEMDRCYGYSC